MRLLLAFLFSVNAFAGAGTFPQGDSVKMLRDKLKFKTGRTMESTDVDPTAIATPGDRGSILVNNTGVFHKNDDGTTTNWSLISGSGIPLLAKGSLITSDGTNNGEFTACADGEIIEWDSTQTNGFKCVTKPINNTSGVIYESPQVDFPLQTGDFTVFTVSNIQLDQGYYSISPVFGVNAPSTVNTCMLFLRVDSDTDAAVWLKVTTTDAVLTGYSAQYYALWLEGKTAGTRHGIAVPTFTWYNAVAGNYDSLNFIIDEPSFDGDWQDLALRDCSFIIRKL